MANRPIEIRLRLYRRFSLKTDLRSWVEALRATNAFVRVIERSGEQWVYVDERLSDESIKQCLFASTQDAHAEPYPKCSEASWDLRLKTFTQFKVVILVGLVTLLCAMDTGLGGRITRLDTWLIVDFYEDPSGIWSSYMPASIEEMHRGLEWSYRLISPIFLHFGVMHLVFNLLWWWILGRQLELRFGSGLLLVLTLSGGILSNIAQYLYAPELPLFGGLSGVIYVLLGFVAVWNLSSKLDKLPIQQNLIVLMVIWLLLCMAGVMEMFGVQVANAAHVSGLVWGIMTGFVALTYAERRQD